MKSSSSGEWFDDFFAGFTAYYLTSLPVFLGVLFSVDFPNPSGVNSTPSTDFVTACVHFDAIHYVDRVRDGYSYDPGVAPWSPSFPLSLLSLWGKPSHRTIG